MNCSKGRFRKPRNFESKPLIAYHLGVLKAPIVLLSRHHSCHLCGVLAFANEHDALVYICYRCGGVLKNSSNLTYAKCVLKVLSEFNWLPTLLYLLLSSTATCAAWCFWATEIALTLVGRAFSHVFTLDLVGASRSL